ncbi:Universal stress protein family 1 [gamma proteobacterium IMCC2047]|nr:Universal stress protein family 1 [gamma proteobacterium IMCC2047]
MNGALQISRLSGAPLSIVYAWRNYAKTYIGSWNNGNKLTSAIWVHEQKEKHQQNLEALISELQESGDQISIELVEGPPEQALPSFINSKSADLLVIGTICRTGIAGMFIGNTAESVLDAVDCSVLTLKPEGFVSPVLERS